ncbi:hypothetical protein DWW31_12255 [Clostridium sp. AF15-17LB]|nr:hypothetical protein DWW31_12255 [Clostridium sp. AF15-17LB]
MDAKRRPVDDGPRGLFSLSWKKRVDERFTEQENSLLAEIDFIQERKLRLSSRRYLERKCHKARKRLAFSRYV